MHTIITTSLVATSSSIILYNIRVVYVLASMHNYLLLLLCILRLSYSIVILDLLERVRALDSYFSLCFLDGLVKK